MKKLVVLFVLFSILSSFALTGTVVDELANPIESVSVYLKVQDTTVYTDASGTFLYDLVTPNSIPLVNTSQTQLSYNGNNLTISLPQVSPVTVGIYTIRGQQIMQKKLNLQSGMNNVALPELSSGLYVMRAKIGSEQMTQKFIGNQSFSWSGAKTNTIIASNNTRKSRAIIDTVTFSKDGYFSTTGAITTYDDDMGTIILYPIPAVMKLIPSVGQSFTMGVTDAPADETQQVTFTYNFYMDSIEVTQGKYDTLMSDAVYGYTDYSKPAWDTTYGVGDNYPAYYIDWYDVVLYTNALSKAYGRDTVYTYTTITGIPGNGCELSNIAIDYTKNGFRLPTEAEWEFAVRSGTTTDYYWEDNAIDNFAWYYSNSGHKTHEIALKLPNAYGLYDMSGNVLEWCGDWYGSYSSETVIDPTGPSTGYYRISRGGSWSYSSSYLRSGYRRNGTPNIVDERIGFRVVLPQ